VPRLKVLHVITTFPRLSGAADNTRYTVNLLNSDRYDTHLACGVGELDASRVASHVRVIPLPSLVRPVAPMSDLRTAWALYRLCRRERYDIVHTHLSKAGVLGRLAARLAGVPVIVHTAHTISFAASASPISNWFFQVADRACAVFSAKIITVSKVNTATYLDHRVGRPAQYVTIHSGVETSKYLDRSERAKCRDELGIQDNDLLIVWIGRLNRQKDPVTFVRAARNLADHLPQARFVMVGEDPLGESLEGQVRTAIRESDMEASLRLLGYRADVHRILAAADLVVHTSLYEGLARSVVETMLAGVPLVATAVDGVLEAVVSGERGGFLVQPSDPAQLAQAALQLLQNPVMATRVATAGQAWARERFDVSDMVRAIDDLYQQLWDEFTRRRS
jgi:glycosyltransferase involved in cell wall biosynthesis